MIFPATLKSDFRSAYETYIKHYPLSESHHRKELTGNSSYQSFMQTASSDPRIRKRDLITFLSRPVTRLPRLNLVLEQILKLTKEYKDEQGFEHPDLETLPIILGILSDCIKSTQPGIESAESKVKFWALCESLGYRKGEIIVTLPCFLTHPGVLMKAVVGHGPLRQKPNPGLFRTPFTPESL